MEDYKAEICGYIPPSQRRAALSGPTTYFHHLSWKAIKTLMATEMIAFTSRS
jgi:hypothetical protein